jgi:hypothetical protein
MSCYLYRILVITGNRSVTHTSVELVPCLAHVPGPVILKYEIPVYLGL